MNVLNDVEPNNNNEFEVENILNKRVNHGRVEYLLKWKNYDNSHNCWIPSVKLNCDKLVNNFEQSQLRRTKRRCKSSKSERSKKKKLNNGMVTMINQTLYPINQVQ